MSASASKTSRGTGLESREPILSPALGQWGRRRFFSVVLVVTALGLSGCCAGPEELGSQEAPAALSPPQSKSEWKRQQWALRTNGVRFEPQRVVVEDRPGAIESLRQETERRLSENRRWDALSTGILLLRSAPTDARAHQLLAEVLVSLDRIDEAKGMLDRGLEYCDATDVLTDLDLDRAQLDIREGDHSAAIERLRVAVERSPDHGPAHRQLALSLYYANRPDEAWTHAVRARDLGAAPPRQFWPLLEAARRR